MGIDQVVALQTNEFDLSYKSMASNPDYFIQVDLKGNLLYMNSNVRDQFQRLFKEGKNHPFLQDWETVIKLLFANQNQCFREVVVENQRFQQKFFYNPMDKKVNLIIREINDENKSAAKPMHKASEYQIRDINQTIKNDQDLSLSLQSIVNAAVALIKSAGRSELYILNNNIGKLEAVAVSQQNEQKSPTNNSYAHGVVYSEYVISTGKALNSEDPTISNKNLPFLNKSPAESLLIVPIKLDNVSVGTLNIYSHIKKGFDDFDELALKMLSGLALVAMRNAVLREVSQLRLKEANSLFYISQGISESLTIEAMFKSVIQLLQEIFGYSHVQVYLLDEASGNLYLEKGSGLEGLKLKRKHHHIKYGEGIIGNVAITGLPFVTNDVDSVPFYIQNPVLSNIKSEMAVPIRTSNNLIGVLDIQLEPTQEFTDDELRLMTTVAELLASGIEKSILYNALQSALRQEQAMRTQLVQSEKLAAIGRIVASVAHELNNPLQAIQNALYLVQLENSDNYQMKEDLQVAISETKRIADLIKRLRQTYRPVDHIKYEYQDIPALIEEVKKIISTHLRHNNIIFDFKKDQEIPPCPMIRDQIKQVLLNICLNAVETMTDGGRLCIRVDHNKDTEHVSISISDSGKGIPQDIKPFIFDPFFTTKENGTGLGLAISHDIIQRHMGEIEVSSQENEGTTIFVKLPLEYKDVHQI